MREIVSPIGSVFAEFATPDEMLRALTQLREQGYRALESFSPFPVPGARELIAAPRSRLPLLVFAAGLLGAVGGYAVQWYVNVRSYPLNIGGRPTHAVPAFILPSFEGAVLCAALAAFVGFLVALRLPRPWHPVFEIDRFEHASVDRYWVAVDLRDRRWDRSAHEKLTERDLAALRPLRVIRLETGA
jgi:hypothetical protein